MTLRSTKHQVVKHQDIVADPVFERLIWQGYGDGIWWRGELVVNASTIAFLIDGENYPDFGLVARAHHIAATHMTFLQSLDQFLADEAHRRPEEAKVIKQLKLISVALFLGRVEDDPEAYCGEFAILQPCDHQSLELPFVQEWRCDIQDGHFANLKLCE